VYEESPGEPAGTPTSRLRADTSVKHPGFRAHLVTCHRVLPGLEVTVVLGLGFYSFAFLLLRVTAFAPSRPSAPSTIN
jgi:hypothetical protein